MSVKEPIKIKVTDLYANAWIVNANQQLLGDCTICREKLYEKALGGDVDEVMVIKGMCNHYFHEYCINRWVKTNPMCPFCGVKWEANGKAFTVQ